MIGPIRIVVAAALAVAGFFVLWNLFITPIQIERMGISSQMRNHTVFRERRYVLKDGMPCVILGGGNSLGTSCDWDWKSR